MDLRQKAMQDFRGALEQRRPSILRIAKLSAVSFGAVQQASFTVTAEWLHPQPGSFSKTYTAGDVFVPARPGQPRFKMSFCRFRDELCRAILQARGVY